MLLYRFGFLEDNSPGTSGCSDLLTVIVTTSPVRSNPSTDLLEEVFESLRLALGTESCRKIVVFDGYIVHKVKCEKKGRITEDMENKYKEYILRVKNLSKSSTLFENTSFLVLEERHGFGHAVKKALNEVSTKYVMIVQHDFVFWKQVTVINLLQVLESHQEVNYVGFISASTENYATTRNHGPNQHLPLDVECFNNIPFVKLMFWYDKIHIARTDYYKNVVFGKYCCVRKGQFIEDRLGHWQLKKIYLEGLEKAHWRFGTYLWYPDEGRERYIQHLEGRKFQLEKVKAELYPERLTQKHLWHPSTVERFERQFQRNQERSESPELSLVAQSE